MKLINPDTIVKPASMYSQGVQVAPSRQRLIISGQVGLRPDGTLEPTMRGQMERTWSNLFAVLHAAGFEKRHLAKMTIYVTEPAQTGLFREIRDRMMEGHACAATYLQVAGLSSPQFKFEIEAEAVKEAD
ncbi:MAG: RidA family protein [Hyphomicrobiaceae bacterium]